MFSEIWASVLPKLFSIRTFYTFSPTQCTARFLDEYGEANLTYEIYTTANSPRKTQLRGTYTVWGKLCSNVIVFCVKRITRRLKIYPKIFSSPSWSRNRMVECISSRFQTFYFYLSLSLYIYIYTYIYALFKRLTTLLGSISTVT